MTNGWNDVASSAEIAVYAVVPSRLEDFRGDVSTVRASGKPSLTLHGTADHILPFDSTSFFLLCG